MLILSLVTECKPVAEHVNDGCVVLGIQATLGAVLKLEKRNHELIGGLALRITLGYRRCEAIRCGLSCHLESLPIFSAITGELREVITTTASTLFQLIEVCTINVVSKAIQHIAHIPHEYLRVKF
jgi:hypothetical protein